MAEFATGARARFSLDGVKVGYATGVNVREMINYEAVKVLDSIIVKEHVPVDYDCSMSAEFFRVVGDTLKSRGWFPSQGRSAADFLRNLLDIGEMTATIEDSKTGKVIAHVEGVKISEKNTQINARGLVGSNVTMVAKLARDESDISA